MKKSFHSALLVFLVLPFTGCTKSTDTTVNILDRSAFFKVSSASPYTQDNAGGYIRVAGSCLANVQKFQIQWDGGLWVDVPLTAQAPGAGEYLPEPAPPFDQNCADRNYDFYIFISTLRSMFGLSGDVSPTIGLGLRPVGSGYTGEAIFYPAPVLSSIQFSKDEFSNPTKIVVGSSNRYRVQFFTADGSKARGGGISVQFVATATDGTSSANLPVFSCPLGNSTVDGNCTNITGSSVTSNDDQLEFWISPNVQSGWSDPSRYQISLAASCVGGGCAVTPDLLSVNTRALSDYTTYLSMSFGFPSKIVSGIAYAVSVAFHRYDFGSFSLGSSNEFSMGLKDLSGTANLSMSGTGCTQTAGSLDCHVMGSGTAMSGMNSSPLSLTVINGSRFQLGVGNKNNPVSGTAYAFDGTAGSWIEVDQSGDSAYAAPAIQKYPSKLDANSCASFLLVAGNSAGAALPSSGQHFVKMEVLDKNSSMIAGALYPSSDPNCSSAGSNSVSTELDNLLPWMDQRIKVTSMPVDGQIILRTVETSGAGGAEIPATERKTILYWESH